jgi:hypothetical protein
MRTLALWLLVLAFGAAASTAQACRSGGNQRVLLNDEIPAFAQASDLVLRVRVRSVNARHTIAIADVLEVKRGAFRGRSVRIEVASTAACGPSASVGQSGFVAGRLVQRPEGVLLAPRTRTWDGRLVEGP